MKKKLTKKELKEKEERKRRLREKAKRHARETKEEMQKAIVTALTAAFGFLIALSWRGLITEYVDMITAISPISGKLIEALTVTIICTLGIVLVSKFATKKD